MKILLVEDDERILRPLAEALSDHNYAVDTATDGLAGWELIEAFPYDLVVLDLMLPKLDGISLCHQIRQAGYTMPVLILTARDASSDKVIGLDVGADDYVIKPFDLKELLARIRALLRRGSGSTSPVLVWGELQLDPATCKVIYADRLLSLTPKEYALLELLLRRNGGILTRNDILDHLWSSEEPPGQETVKVHIRGLRQKLIAVNAANDFIETIYGLGYRLKQDI